MKLDEGEAKERAVRDTRGRLGERRLRGKPAIRLRLGQSGDVQITRWAIAVPVAMIAVVLSAGPLFLGFGWFVGLDVHVKGGFVVVIVNVVTAVLAWRAVGRLTRPRHRRSAAGLA